MNRAVKISDGKFITYVDGDVYHVDASTNNNTDFYFIRNINGKRDIIEAFGQCNPLRSLWRSHVWHRVHGAARNSMECKCILESVLYEIERHKEYIHDSFLNGLESEIAL